MTRGTLRDTYVAALQHDLVNLPDQAALVGVVRSPMPWFAPTVDENHPALGPPQTLLEQIKRRTEELEADGLSDAEAHNTAWDDVDFEQRYREHLNTDDEARTMKIQKNARHRHIIDQIPELISRYYLLIYWGSQRGVRASTPRQAQPPQEVRTTSSPDVGPNVRSCETELLAPRRSQALGS